MNRLVVAATLGITALALPLVAGADNDRDEHARQGDRGRVENRERHEHENGPGTAGRIGQGILNGVFGNDANRGYDPGYRGDPNYGPGYGGRYGGRVYPPRPYGGGPPYPGPGTQYGPDFRERQYNNPGPGYGPYNDGWQRRDNEEWRRPDDWRRYDGGERGWE